MTEVSTGIAFALQFAAIWLKKLILHLILTTTSELCFLKEIAG
jgi:hypothetical protein